VDLGGVRYFCLKEGYSVLVVMSGPDGRDLYGVHVPLQSIQQADRSRLYATGTATEAMGFPYPQPPEAPRFELKLTFWPSLEDRKGQVLLETRPLEGEPGREGGGKRTMVEVGAKVDLGEVTLSPREIRYWVGMTVRYDPGLPAILTSLCLGLLGMCVTFAGRLRQGSTRKRAG
jgi:hypothetical protein